MNNTRGTEEQLREVLETVADAVPVAPEDFRAARNEWRRRERRRRLVLTVLVAVVFALAVLAGLWVLNDTPSRPHVIFNGSVSTSSWVPTGSHPAVLPTSGGITHTG